MMNARVIGLPLLQQKPETTLDDLRKKMLEEAGEASDEITNYIALGRIPDRNKAIAELLDNIQVDLAIINGLLPYDDSLLDAGISHWDKLAERGWQVKGRALVRYGGSVERLLLAEFVRCQEQGRTPDCDLMDRAKAILEVE